MDESEAMRWVQRSGRAWQDLRSEIEACKRPDAPDVYETQDRLFTYTLRGLLRTDGVAGICVQHNTTIVLGDSHPMYSHLSNFGSRCFFGKETRIKTTMASFFPRPRTR
jgi:hypothetical protein